MFRTTFSRVFKPSAARMMSSSATAPTSYSTGVQLMHWTSGGAMLCSIGLVLAAQNTKVKEDKGKYMFLHKSFGTAALAVLVPRLAIRLTSKLPGHIEGTMMLERWAADLSHYAMYGFVIFMPVSGALMGLNGGNGLPFFYTTIPALPKQYRSGQIVKQAYEYHKIAGKALEYFVLLHVGGALQHVVRGHPIFSRILGLAKGPGQK